MSDLPPMWAVGFVGFSLLLLPNGACSALRPSVSQAHAAIWTDAVALLGMLLSIVTVTMVGLVLFRILKRAIRTST